MRYFFDKRLLCVLFMFAGFALCAVGLRDLAIAHRSWHSDFETSDSQKSVTVATARFVDRPYSGFARIARGRPFDATGFRLIVNDTLQQAGNPFVDTLKISQYGEDEYLRLSVGAEVQVNDSVATVVALRPFVGLWPDAQGVPMASVSVRHRDSWTDDILLRSDQWLLVEGGIAIRFLWCKTEEEARRLAEGGRPGIETARWGVRDEGRTHWFHSFIPGAGVELADGRVVTLRGLDSAEAAIEVGIFDRNEVSSRRIQANADDPLIVFEHPSSMRDMLLLYAWDDAEVLATYFPQAGDSSREAIANGREWKPGVGDFAIRLEQVSRAAVAVEAGQDTIFEAVLDFYSSRVRVRQGEAVRMGDALLRYTRVPKEKTGSYHMTLVDARGRESQFALELGKPYTFSTAFGTFSLQHEDLDLDTGVTLRPKGYMIPLRLEIGIAFVALALAGLVFMRRAAR